MFNKKEKFKTYIEPIIDQLLTTCEIHNIPLFVSLAVADDGSKTTYENYMLSSDGLDLALSQDHLYRHVAVINGAKVDITQTEDGFGARFLPDVDDTMVVRKPARKETKHKTDNDTDIPVADSTLSFPQKNFSEMITDDDLRNLFDDEANDV